MQAVARDHGERDQEAGTVERDSHPGLQEAAQRADPAVAPAHAYPSGLGDESNPEA